MLAYVKTLQVKTEYFSLIEKLLSEGAGMLAISQLSSGAWGFYPVTEPITGGVETPEKTGNLYYTVYCLRALAEIKKAGLPVNPNAIVSAMSYLIKNRNNAGLWSSKGAYFWDVYNDDTDFALSAEVFEVLMLALSQVYPQAQFDNDLSSVKTKISDALKKGAEEPLGVSAAIRGLLYWKKVMGDNSGEGFIRESIDRLIRLKRTGYWEPHWYHAYGGMVELNARILSLLAEYDSSKYASYLREGVTWLLSTRESWGAWHNEIGTANAVCALVAAGVFAQEVPSQIIVSVNGAEVQKVAIDPKDPFMSASKLAYFEITQWCKNGENSVSVRYTGKLDASLIIGIKEWGGKPPDTANTIGVIRESPDTGAIGQALSVKISLTLKSPSAGLTIAETIPSNAEPDPKSLDRLVSNKVITGYSLKDGLLYLSLVQVSGNLEFSYKIVPVCAGKSIIRGTRVYDASSGDLVGEAGTRVFGVIR
jgi:hypothetical protein